MCSLQWLARTASHAEQLRAIQSSAADGSRHSWQLQRVSGRCQHASGTELVRQLKRT